MTSKESKGSRPTAPAGPPIDASRLGAERFDELPEESILDIRGRLYTIGELRKLRSGNTGRGDDVNDLRSKARSHIDTARLGFVSAEQQRIESTNAAVRRDFEGKVWDE